MFPERVQQMHEDREKKFEFEYNVSVCRQVYISDNNISTHYCGQVDLGKNNCMILKMKYVQVQLYKEAISTLFVMLFV